MKFRSLTVASALAALLALVPAATTIAQTVSLRYRRPVSSEHRQATTARVTALPIKQFKLISSGTGWVSTGNRLLWTTDSGAHWKDISPPTPNRDYFASVTFHDAQTGWVVLSYSQNMEDLSFSVARTTDGGSSWSTAPMPEWKSDREHGSPGLADSAAVAFADSQHGWVSLDIQGNTLFASSLLFVTSDGGQTWSYPPRCKADKNADTGRIISMLALTDKDLWLVSHADGESGLFVSHDGGSCFRPVELDAPAEIAPAADASYTLPVFQNSTHGDIAVSFRGPNGSRSAAVLFDTTDSGRTWTPDRILSNLAEGEVVSGAVVGSAWILPFRPVQAAPSVLELDPHDRKAATTGKTTGDFSRCQIRALAINEEWMKCSDGLSATLDGGTTWTNITPRVKNNILTTESITSNATSKPQPSTVKINSAPRVSRALVTGSRVDDVEGGPGIEEHLAFDKDHVFSTDDMETWWESSPYYDVGIYLPGSPSGPSATAPTGTYATAHHYVDLTSTWVSAVQSQGWGIIPIWSGLQAPCACHPNGENPSKVYPGCNQFPHHFSSDTGQANTDGQNQASAAYTAANALGLSGNIIYDDIEAYQSSACGAAVQAFVSGWVSEMHSLGGSGSAGIYSGLDDAGDFESADDAWIPRYDRRVTVWGLNHGDSNSPLTDSFAWTSQARIHQYISENEAWGGAVAQVVDADIVDAAAVPSSGYKPYLVNDAADFDSGDAGIEGAGANGYNDGTTLQSPPGAGFDWDTEEGMVFTNYSQPHWPYSVGITDLANPTDPAVVDGNNPGPQAINDLGQVVGSYYDADYYETGFVYGFVYSPYASPQWTGLSYPSGSPCVILTSINDAGWIVGVWQDTSEDDQFCGNTNNPQHCLLWKPPYADPPQSFDNFGGAANCAQVNGLYSGPYINGLGQYSGTSATGQVIDVTGGVGAAAFIDDAQSSVPSLYDTAWNVAEATDTMSYGISGVNNNGQVAGTIAYGEWNYDWDVPRWFTDSVDDVFIDSNSTVYVDSADPVDCGYFTGPNDSTQIMTGSCVIRMQE